MQQNSCVTCGAKFSPSNKGQKFCSSTCYGVSLKKEQKGHRKKCAHCQSVFYGDNRVRYCSLECARQSERNRVTLTCLQCGTTFERAKSQQHKKYCSRACYFESRRDRIPLTCQHCGQVFEVQRWYAENGRKCCTKQCADAMLTNKVTCACGACGKHFDRTPSQAQHGEKNYCSKECATIGSQKQWTDEQLREMSHSDINYKHYWRLLAQRIRIRDHHTCQLCGKVQHRPALHVHHIKPLSTFALEELQAANLPDNLTSLCNSCHKRAEMNPDLLNAPKPDFTHAYLVQLLVP